MNQLINEGESPWKRAWQRFKHRKFTLFCLGVILFYVLIAVLGYAHLLPDFQERVGTANEAPTLGFAKILGTDLFGRSVLYKIFVGAQTAITIGFLTTAIALPVGIFLGSISGYFGGKID